MRANRANYTYLAESSTQGMNEYLNGNEKRSRNFFIKSYKRGKNENDIGPLRY